MAAAAAVAVVVVVWEEGEEGEVGSRVEGRGRAFAAILSVDPAADLSKTNMHTLLSLFISFVLSPLLLSSIKKDNMGLATLSSLYLGPIYTSWDAAMVAVTSFSR